MGSTLKIPNATHQSYSSFVGGNLRLCNESVRDQWQLLEHFYEYDVAIRRRCIASKSQHEQPAIDRYASKRVGTYFIDHQTIVFFFLWSGF